MVRPGSLVITLSTGNTSLCSLWPCAVFCNTPFIHTHHKALHLESTRAFTGLCHGPGGTLLPCREPLGFCWALRGPGQCPATSQRPLGLSLGFAKALAGPSLGTAVAVKGPCCPPQCSRAFARLCGGLGRVLLTSSSSVLMSHRTTEASFILYQHPLLACKERQRCL